MRSHVLEGTVRHRRVRPFVYDLDHSVYYLALDLDELDEVARGGGGGGGGGPAPPPPPPPPPPPIFLHTWYGWPRRMVLAR
jgi:hypothetical protein